MTPEISAQFVCLSPKVSNFWKKSSLWMSVVRATGYSFLPCMTFLLLMSTKDLQQFRWIKLFFSTSVDSSGSIHLGRFLIFSIFDTPLPLVCTQQKKLKSLQGAGATRPCGWPVCRCTAGPPWAAWTWCGWSGWWGAIVETGLVWCWIIWWLAPWLAPELVIEATVSVSCGCCCWGGCWGCKGCWVCWPPLPSCGGRLCRISGGAISYL